MHRILMLFSVGGLLSLAACEGPAGKDGVDGADGADGINGADGADGVDGEDGTDGVDGEDGTDGVNGEDGTDGTDGADGEDGHDGRDGHNGDAPWGVNLTLIEVGGASGSGGQFQIGDYPVITFSLLDDDGNEYEMSELYGMYFMLAGPTSHYQVALYYSDMASVISNAVYNWDGTWTYTSSIPIPATYDTASNNTSDIGLDEGDYSGEPLEDGTYTLAAWAYVRVTNDDGSYYYEASNATQDVLVGAATTIEPREVVLEENCADCHGEEFMAHGGSRRDLKLCLTCHVDGAEDRYSATDSTVTPGVSVSMSDMIHRLHAGSYLSNGYEVAAYPSDSTAEGYPNYNLVDFSDVVFPNWPMETANCASCHEGAADGDVSSKPTRKDCGSCHDIVDFTQTDTSAEDYHSGGPQADDSNCAVCHTSSGVEGYHNSPLTSSTTWTDAGHASSKTGINVDLLTAVNQDGSSSFSVGDTITVTFTVKYDDGTDIPQSFFAYSATSSTCPTIAGGASLKFAGPSDYMQLVLSSASPSSTTIVGSLYGSSTVDSSGVWTYTFTDSSGVTATVPDVFPAQENDDLLTGVIWGDLVGQTLLSGTYRLGLVMYTTMWDDIDCGEDAARWRAVDMDYIDVLVGDATTVEPHAVVSDAECNACHGAMEYHGSTRVGVDYCVTCHTPGSADNEETPLVTVDFPVMIHKIHASDMLENGYSIDGTSFDVAFPRQDGGVQACDACHGTNEAYLNASTRACITCHDSDAAAAHAALNTDDTYGESCEVCHGSGSEFSVETMHAFTR